MVSISRMQKLPSFVFSWCSTAVFQHSPWFVKQMGQAGDTSLVCSAWALLHIYINASCFIQINIQHHFFHLEFHSCTACGLMAMAADVFLRATCVGGADGDSLRVALPRGEKDFPSIELTGLLSSGEHGPLTISSLSATLTLPLHTGLPTNNTRLRLPVRRHIF